MYHNIIKLIQQIRVMPPYWLWCWMWTIAPGGAVCQCPPRNLVLLVSRCTQLSSSKACRQPDPAVTWPPTMTLTLPLLFLGATNWCHGLNNVKMSADGTTNSVTCVASPMTDRHLPGRPCHVIGRRSP